MLDRRADRAFHGGELFSVFGDRVHVVEKIVAVPEHERRHVGADRWVLVRRLNRLGLLSAIYFRKVIVLETDKRGNKRLDRQSKL